MTTSFDINSARDANNDLFRDDKKAITYAYQELRKRTDFKDIECFCASTPSDVGGEEVDLPDCDPGVYLRVALEALDFVVDYSESANAVFAAAFFYFHLCQLADTFDGNPAKIIRSDNGSMAQLFQHGIQLRHQTNPRPNLDSETWDELSKRVDCFLCGKPFKDSAGFMVLADHVPVNDDVKNQQSPKADRQEKVSMFGDVGMMRNLSAKLCSQFPQHKVLQSLTYASSIEIQVAPLVVLFHNLPTALCSDLVSLFKKDEQVQHYLFSQIAEKVGLQTKLDFCGAAQVQDLPLTHVFAELQSAYRQ
mmetsp:Transcript_3956/g.5927  ORF Transcript_3956/g.5927 Transcript_3956/m.5927 type:complete len:306 (+) Transcript_3956:30-947(+)